jgi:hypothetical protein
MLLKSLRRHMLNFTTKSGWLAEGIREGKEYHGVVNWYAAYFDGRGRGEITLSFLNKNNVAASRVIQLLEDDIISANGTIDSCLFFAKGDVVRFYVVVGPYGLTAERIMYVGKDKTLNCKVKLSNQLRKDPKKADLSLRLIERPEGNCE